jgi:hypothetical protein
VAWTNSKIFSALIADALNNTAALDLNSDAINVALFDNSITPSQTVASASTAYGAGVWASGGVVDTGASAPAGWPAVGRPLTVTTSAFTTNVYTFDGNDVASANATTTLTNAYGCLVYEDTLTTPVADQGICFLYLGGPNTVTNGSFSVVFGANLFSITL